MGKSERKHQAWNFWSAFVFFALVVLVGYLLDRQGIRIERIGIRDALVIILASFRMTRIIVFEKIFKYLRDVLRRGEDLLVVGTLSNIITCPWCSGVWVTLIIIVFYYLVPYGMLLCYVLALSGVVSLVILYSNMVQMRAERKQRIHERNKRNGPSRH
jgi:hypothetical protein